METIFCMYMTDIHTDSNDTITNQILCTSQHVQSNLNSLNADGSFTMASSNLFLSTYEILPITQENKYLGKFSYFIMKLYVVCIH